MDSLGLKGRTILAQRFWQPTSACLTCMSGNVSRFIDLGHWVIALQTGLGTGVLVLLLTFTPASGLLRNRAGNAAVVSLLTMAGDAYSHSRHETIRWAEVLLTGMTAGVFALLASYAFQDRGRRLRSAWAAFRK